MNLFNFHYRGATVYVAAGQISQKLSAKEIYLLCRSATVYVTRQRQIYAETESNENELVQTALLFNIFLRSFLMNIIENERNSLPLRFCSLYLHCSL